MKLQGVTRPGALMTVTEVQRELGMGVTSLYRMMADGRLQKVKIASATRITRESVDRLIDAGRQASEGRRPGWTNSDQIKA